MFQPRASITFQCHLPCLEGWSQSSAFKAPTLSRPLCSTWKAFFYFVFLRLFWPSRVSPGGGGGVFKFSCLVSGVTKYSDTTERKVCVNVEKDSWHTWRWYWRDGRAEAWHPGWMKTVSQKYHTHTHTHTCWNPEIQEGTNEIRNPDQNKGAKFNLKLPC